MANRETTTEQTIAEMKEDTIDAPALEKRSLTVSILIIDSDKAVETQENVEDTTWYDLQNTYRTKKILAGQLGGIKRMKGGGTTAIVYYKKFRVVIPLTEMMTYLPEDESHNHGRLSQRQNRILGNMLGCEADLIIKGLNSNSWSLVTSRRDVMLKKRQIFYPPDINGNSRVYVDCVVQAHAVAAAEKVVRVEIFGVETSILAHDLSWGWLSSTDETFHVGDQVLVRILDIAAGNLEHISVRADVKSVNGDTSKANLNKYKIQSKYIGTVTDIHKGIVFIRPPIRVSAIAHNCYDSRTSDKRNEVSFVVTRIDENWGVAVGLISRIIRQNT